MPDATPNRRDFLTGRAVRSAVEQVGNRLADEIVLQAPPSRGPMQLLRTTAMACDFDVMVNPTGPAHQIEAASTGLDLVHQLEQQMSVYRENSELSMLNRRAFDEQVRVDPDLFNLLLQSRLITEQTDGAFEPSAGAMIRLWRDCRQQGRIPTQAEINQTLLRCGIANVQFDTEDLSVRFNRPGIEFNLGAIGKGYAVDRVAECLLAAGVNDWLIHGGRSSIRASGGHAGHDGWPVGLQNPLLPEKQFGTLLLKDASLATSGTAVQWFRYEGRRYGHILDPRTGWPVESLLSVSVIAPTSAMADALSTAFFVLGVEKSLASCDNLSDRVGVVFFPLPKQGQTLQPILHNVSQDQWFPG